MATLSPRIPSTLTAMRIAFWSYFSQPLVWVISRTSMAPRIARVRMINGELCYRDFTGWETINGQYAQMFITFEPANAAGVRLFESAVR